LTAIHTLSDDDIKYVTEMTQEAGRLAVKMRSGVSIREKTGPQDIVTAADLELSKLIVGRLKARFARDIVVSEEDEKHESTTGRDRVWLVDPIDGTDNYVANDGQYSVMIGLLENCKPTYGWVYAPAIDTMYYGGPNCGAWKQIGNQAPVQYQKLLPPLDMNARARVMMGFRDRKNHPWVMDHPKVTLIKAGSIGIKVAKVLDDVADVFVHLSGKLKTWDTAGPAAIALGGFLEVGGLDADELIFPLPAVRQTTSVIIGRSGSLAWARTYLNQKSTDVRVQI
jgi:3'(2'), 5'-bisphosphate nucleotidase